MKKAKLFSLGLKDWIKGLVMAVLAAVVVLIQETIATGSLHFDWQSIGKTALLTAIAYITKNFLTNSKDEFLSKEP